MGTLKPPGAVALVLQEKSGFAAELEKVNEVLVKENEELESQKTEELEQLRRMAEEREEVRDDAPQGSEQHR